MTLFADMLLAVVGIVSPADGATVPTLGAAHKEYLAQSGEARARAMGDAKIRRALVSAGATQQPLKLEWSGGTGAVYRLEIASGAGERQVFSVSNRTDCHIVNLEVDANYTWSVSGPDGSTATASFLTEAFAPRLLRAGGVGNFRDLGGWRCAGGGRVRQGMILRSAGLRANARRTGASLFGGSYESGGNRITAAGIATLRGEFGVRTDIELRNRQEAALMGSSVLGPDVRWVHVPFAAYDFIDNLARGREPFAKLFTEFLDRANYPILFHCSGGRDRTGTLAFLLNGLLGVGDDDLCRDWEATVFFEEDTGFSADRLRRLLDYLKSLGGSSYAERCERYALACGISREEIETFRRIMIESGD